ncbi:MAG: aminopeptidase P family protein [bacterium]|nr:aminopeptidase P family protein [bacterium]
MSSRLLKIRKIIKEKKVDVFWLPNREKSGQPDTRYLSGFTGSDSHLLITRNKAYLLTDGRYLVAARKEVPDCAILDISKQRLSELLKKNLPKTGKKIILIDGSVTNFSLVEKIKEKISNIEIENADGMLQDIRRIKTGDEIKLLKKASDIACQAFGKLLPFIKTGMTEKWLARKLTDLLLDCGAEAPAFDPIVASGPNSALPHSIPTERKLKKGDLVIIDFGAKYQGYISDMTRTVAIGKISSNLLKMYEAVREAQENGCETIRMGVPASSLDSACRDILKKHDLEKYFTHATGHGIGLEVHELPVISSKTEQLLQIGEAITCEPGVYIEGLGGVRIEDSLVVTEKGTLNLTKSVEKKLIVL